MSRNLILTLTNPHLHESGQYQHTRGGRKRFRLSAPQEQFLHQLWPSRGLTWGEAVSIAEVARAIRRPGRYGVDCDEFVVTATRGGPAT